MDITAALTIAIDVIWPELPALVGDGWPAFATALTPLLQQLVDDPAHASITRAQILALFGHQPAAHARLVELMLEAQPIRLYWNITKGVIIPFPLPACYRNTPRAHRGYTQRPLAFCSTSTDRLVISNTTHYPQPTAPRSICLQRRLPLGSIYSSANPPPGTVGAGRPLCSLPSATSLIFIRQPISPSIRALITTAQFAVTKNVVLRNVSGCHGMNITRAPIGIVG